MHIYTHNACTTMTVTTHNMRRGGNGRADGRMDGRAGERMDRRGDGRHSHTPTEITAHLIQRRATSSEVLDRFALSYFLR